MSVVWVGVPNLKGILLERIGEDQPKNYKQDRMKSYFMVFEVRSLLELMGSMMNSQITAKDITTKSFSH